MNLLFGFSGRIGRLQWWLAQLAIAVILIAGIFIVASAVELEQLEAGNLTASALLTIVAMLALTTWINVASTVKRFHDRDKSGFWFFIVFVPYIGALWQFVECGFLAGTPGVNRYGSPSGTTGLEEFEEEVRATYQQPSRPAAPAAPAVAPRATSATRFSPGGFGRRGIS
jgi:uncharacterized membrane protein YhaH (DUF805 family)